MMRLLQSLSVPAILSAFHKGNQTRKDDGKENSRAMQISMMWVMGMCLRRRMISPATLLSFQDYVKVCNPGKICNIHMRLHC